MAREVSSFSAERHLPFDELMGVDVEVMAPARTGGMRRGMREELKREKSWILQEHVRRVQARAYVLSQPAPLTPQIKLE